jgi:Tol biopolymer transport system component
MPLQPGVRLGSFEVQALLGAGGMGEVYKARDTRLDRVVAIKVLAAHVAADTDRRDRFDREARAISRLNHPNICALHDVGRHEDIDYVVMEYLDGDTLADRIARGPVPLDAALRIAGQIARALEAAHDNGIVHRDLKPGNVMISAGGHVKVLDFGLAKRSGAARGGSDLSDASTMMATTPGVILGTAAYMSPEQATGADVDRTADMWAFGCVLFEMLTGRRAFDGGTMSEILGNVLKAEPDWQRLPPETPERIRRLLRRSLLRDPNARFRDMRDARLEIDDIQEAPAVGGGGTVTSRRRERMAWFMVALLALSAGVLGFRALRPAPIAPEVRLEINTPPTRSASVAVSPDGRQIIFVAEFEGRPQLWLRSLDSQAARALPGTDRATRPFWSPDGRSIGFFADANLKRVDIDGGSPVTLWTAGVPRGGSWGVNGTILFSNSPAGSILRMSSGGGEPTAATQIDATHRGHGSPQFLPDGRHFLFFTDGSPEVRGVYAGRLDSLDTTRLFASNSPAIYAASGHLLFIRDGKLLAQAFDAGRLTLSGAPVPVADNVGGGTAVSASAAGPIVYRTAPPDGGHRQLTWVDRAGQELAKVVYADGAALGPSLSWDGRRIAVYREANGNMDLWSYDIQRRSWDRLTSDPGDDIYPLWSRDGTSVVFGGVRKNQGVVDFYRRLLSAPQASEELVLSTPAGKFPMDLSADGHFLLFVTMADPKRGSDLWAMPLDGDRKPFEVVATEFSESQGQFSPDGQWIAYQSDRTGLPEIYLRPFRGSGADVRVSIDGGTQPRWNRDGEELFFIGADDRMMAVRIRITPSGAEPGAPVGLFATDVGSTAFLVARQQYMVSADGQSFILNSAVAEASSSPVTVILNWRR